jgi:AhpD family alkylhydroperoxidase
MSLHQFREQRERMNRRLLADDNLDIRRFFAIDSRVYDEGALPGRTKELLGLVASLVLRCDDCVSYHLIRCAEEGLSDEEIIECLAVGLVVGGSIVIPHLRRARATLDELRSGGVAAPDTGSESET